MLSVAAVTLLDPRRQDQLVRGRPAPRHLPDPGHRLLLHLDSFPCGGSVASSCRFLAPCRLRRRVSQCARPTAGSTWRPRPPPSRDVLDRLAKQTGMKIVYEGPAPRQLITLSLVGRSAPEAVTAILEGQGLNYALILDATATRVENLWSRASWRRAPGPRGPRGRRAPPRYNPQPEPEPDPRPAGGASAHPRAAASRAGQGPTPPNAPLGPNGMPLPPGVQVLPPGMVLPPDAVLPPATASPVAPVVPTPPGAGPIPQPTPTPPATPP